MRALAAELGVPVMTIYNYVPNKAALLELVQNHMLRPVRVPPPEVGSWEERMRVLQRDARAAVAPQIGVRFGSGFGSSAEAARLADGVMTILADGGFAPDEAALAFATLFTFMLGQIELDAMANTTKPGPGMALMANARPPRFQPDDVFEFAFDVVLEGLKAKRRQRRRASKSAPGRV
jgi:AcrR family transcriptional regulator